MTKLATLTVALLCLCGCVREETDTVGGLQPVVAVGGAYGVVGVPKQPAPVPVTPPAPKPTQCLNCGGTGFIGDGRVKVPCPLCNAQAKSCPTGQCPKNAK